MYSYGRYVGGQPIDPSVARSSRKQWGGERCAATRNHSSFKHSLISYVTYYTHWRPDVVIVMHGINDLTRSFSPPYFAVGPYNEQWTHFCGPAIYGARPPTFEQHLLHTLFMPMIDGWYYQLRARAGERQPFIVDAAR